MNLQENRNKKRTEERFRGKIKIFLDGTKDEKGWYKIKADKKKELIKYIHKISGHVGVTKTYGNIYKYYLVENIKSKVEEVCRNRRKCNYFKIRIESKKPNVKIYAEKIFETVSTDVYGPINLDNIGHNEVQKKVI
jgi:hypothetical protein